MLLRKCKVLVTKGIKIKAIFTLHQKYLDLYPFSYNLKCIYNLKSSLVLNFNEYIKHFLVVSKSGNSCNMDYIELT